MRVAVIDSNTGVLIGFDTVDQPDSTHVPVPDDCDLTPGDYRWDGACFMHIASEIKAGSIGLLSLVVKDILTTLASHQIELSQICKDYLAAEGAKTP